MPSGTHSPQDPTAGPAGAADFPVVGLGASAGGLDAFRRFFESVPVDSGLAYILIQHLDPSHESLLVELLAGRLTMPVLQATDGMTVERDHVYVIAPGCYLAIEGGRFRLSEPRERHGARLPFDFFLHSLADACGERAIAVILSGTGGDGSLGLRAIREKGGVVIAQDPEEAAFDGMPRSAIATGCVDRVLPVAEISTAILRLSRPGGLSGRGENGPALETDRLAEIVELLRRQTSHDFSPYKEGTLVRRIERRMAAAGISDSAAYLDNLRRDDGEIDRLAKDLLISVTHFFRDANAFESLTDEVAAALVRALPLDRPLRIWVPGSSSGEEAYSLAMLFLEAIATAKRRVKLQIFASDVDADSVATARGGVYPESIEDEVTPERLARFFTREPAGYRVTPELRGAVVFTIQDLLSDPPFSRLDLISCRNLLIYLRPEAQRRVLLLFHFALRESGVLFLGGAETVGDLGDHFEPINKKQRIYRRIGRSRPEDVDFSLGGSGGRAVWSRAASKTCPPAPDLGALMREQLLNSYAPASILINRKHEIVFTLGPMDRYLRVAPGEPSRDALTMVREGLRTKLRSAIQRAGQEQRRVVVTGAELGGDGDTISIDVQPLRNGVEELPRNGGEELLRNDSEKLLRNDSEKLLRNGGEELLLVSFRDEPQPESPPSGALGGARDPTRVAELERELESTSAELQNAIRDLEIANEEQKAINEEAMSVNEEYQSANEELETSKEELQSLNEELTALNNQLQETIERQRATAADLQNILNCSDVATLFLDRQLNIRFFTPAAKSLFGVIAGDIGRPLADLARRFDDPDLLIDARAVLTTSAPKRHEVRTDANTWHLRGALPYQGHDGRIEGVVITFVDISEIKAVEQELQTARSYAENIVDTVHQPLLVLDRNLRVVSANRSFFRVFGLKPDATIGWHFATCCAPSGGTAGLRSFLDMVRAGPGLVEDHEIEIDLPALGLRQLMVNARNIRTALPEEPLILLAIDDITERKSASTALEAAKREAEHANIAKSRFLAAASHDLRQPLQTLSLLQGLLARKITEVGDMELVARLGESLDVMSGMLNTLLDINQLDAGVVQTQLSRFPINAILARLDTEFRYHTQARGLGWRVVGCRLAVRSDAHLLEQVIRNLLSNAVKYTAKGRVLLGCRRRGDKLRIEIWDTGIGVPQALLHAIFEEYRQLGNAARERSKGLGLGLTIVQRLADMLGHAVDVRSVPDKGSMFSIEVPIAAAADRMAPPPLPDRSKFIANTIAGQTVMIVEDDPATREALHLLMDGEGYRTLTFADGVKVLEAAARGGIRPNLIVADYNLPGALTGTQMVEAMRRTTERPIPAIILTGDISADTLQEISRHGCHRLSKPVQTAPLVWLIRDLLTEAPGLAGQAPAPVPVLPATEAAPKQAATGPAPAAPSRSSPPTIFVVDDDRELRETMRQLLESDQKIVETYPSAEAFLEAWRPERRGCLVVDAHMGGLSGIELIERLAAEGHTLPSIVITGFGDIKMAVQAMKAGAVDFIEKPVRADQLLASIGRAITLPADHDALASSRHAAEALVAGLTERQREIMAMVLAGCPSKNIAADLGISQRTVENHRAAIMRKTGAKSIPALARLALGLV